MVVAILAILMAMAVPQMIGYTKASHRMAGRTEAYLCVDAVQRYLDDEKEKGTLSAGKIVKLVNQELSNPRNISRNIIRLAADTDGVFFELAKTVIDHGRERFGMELMDHLYLSLTDHLSYAVQRVKDGIIFQNFYTLEMRKFNPHEFEVGNFALDLVEEKLGVRLPDDEAGNIALHFINAQQDNPYNSQNQVINSVVEDILSIIKYSFHIVYDKEDTSYTRCVTHLRLFAQRLMKGEMMPRGQ